MKGKQKQSERSISSETAHSNRLLPSSSSSLFSLSSSGKSVIANLAAASSSLISSTVSPTVTVHPLPETLKRSKSSKKNHNSHSTAPRVDSNGDSKTAAPVKSTVESIYSTNQQPVNVYSTVSTDKNTTVTSLTHVTPIYTCQNSRSHLIIPQSDLGTFRTLLSGWETVTAAPPAASSSSLNTNYESSSLRSSSSLGMINSRSSALANREAFLYGTPSSCETSPMSFNFPPYPHTVPPTFKPVTAPSDSVTSTSSSYRHASVDRLNSRRNIYERAVASRVTGYDQENKYGEVKATGHPLITYSLFTALGDQYESVDEMKQSKETPTVTVNLPSTSSSTSSKSNIFSMNQSDIIDDHAARDKYINLTSKAVASFTASSSSHRNGEENLFDTRAHVSPSSASYNDITGCKVFLKRRKNDDSDKQVRGEGDTFDSLFNQNNEIELHVSEKTNQPSASFTTPSPFTPSCGYRLHSTPVARGGAGAGAGGAGGFTGGKESNEQVKQLTETYGKFKVTSVTVNPQSNIESSPLPSSSSTTTPAAEAAAGLSSSLFTVPCSDATINTLATSGTSGGPTADTPQILGGGTSDCPLKAAFTVDKYLTRDTYNAPLSRTKETNNDDDRSKRLSLYDGTSKNHNSKSIMSISRGNDETLTNNSDQFVGFAHYAIQVYKKIVKKGFKYNVMIVGESGTGKSTGINCLFHTDIYSTDYPGPSARASNQSTVSVESTRIILKENNIKIDLTVTDTPGFACALDNNDCFVPIIKFIDDKYKEFFDYETSIHRTHITDSRVHVLLYFIAPSGHSLRLLDIEVMKRLSGKVNIIPIISKADTFTADELLRFKNNIRNDLDVNHIKYVKFFKCSSGNIHAPDLCGNYEHCACSGGNETDAQSIKCNMVPIVPFALIGSNYIYHNPTTGECTRLRKYPWGSVQGKLSFFSLFIVSIYKYTCKHTHTYFHSLTLT